MPCLRMVLASLSLTSHVTKKETDKMFANERIAKAFTTTEVKDSNKHIASEGPLSVYYSPFDYVNSKASVVLIGITPGEMQAKNANTAFAEALAAGKSNEEALKIAKREASFSGPMRARLIELLDHAGLARWLRVPSTASVFDVDSNLMHFTSMLRYPVFVNGANYSGRQPKALRSPLLTRMLQTIFLPELASLSGAVLVPLGDAVQQVMQHYVAKGLLDGKRVLFDIPHPSGANAERCSVFLGRKRPVDCSTKTDGEAILAGFHRIQRQLESI